MRIFVTGLAGFIGSHVAAALLADGHKVWGCDDLSFGKAGNVPVAARWTDDAVQQIARVDADVFVHLAAVACARWPDDAYVWEQNLGATVHALNLAERAGARFVFASTAAAAFPQSSAYAGAKWAAEQLALARGATVLRFANVYGPRQRDWGHEPGVLAAWQKAIRHGDPLTIHGDGAQTRDFIHVDDVTRAVLAATCSDAADGRIADVCTGVQVAIRDVAESWNWPVVHAARTIGDPDVIWQDPAPARELLGFAAPARLAVTREAA